MNAGMLPDTSGCDADHRLPRENFLGLVGALIRPRQDGVEAVAEGFAHGSARWQRPR